jgi:hypothetical protein
MKTYIYILLIFIVFSGCDTKITNIKFTNTKIIQSKIAKQNELNSDSEAPFLVWSSKKQPNPAIISPAIFYSPHQDDETISMGASIAEHVRKGRPVYVVLFTNGAGSNAINILNGKEKCSSHNTFHHFNLSLQDLINARNDEFIAACKKLGVHRVYIANNGKGFDESIGLKNMVTKFKDLILYFQNHYSNISHKVICGNSDYSCTGENCDTYIKSDAHKAGDIAINNLYNSGLVKDARLYKIYIFSSCYNKVKRTANWRKPISISDMLKKQLAFNEYKLYKPEIGRYSIGYHHSVWEYFSNSYFSQYEYVVYPNYGRASNFVK